ncbi:hypothetical protein GCM10011575_05040 [Microlunatus endophyticus]|uniref:Uncharacterized protein n=1 Tax=Microlunatus endophyticus TaxID=1716077 RepID=A0A917S1B2_9ACTN|nr:hypothetical protein [Microlunatus endophyticus]GGL49855.1 hypothetical protein GCM10011575_05040 [Microlunatus endophyticus]
MPILITITGPIAAGKNTVAELLADHVLSTGRTVVVADVDDVADMLRMPAGDGKGRLWFRAHQAHGALVGQWMRSDVDVVISIGPVYTREEQDALYTRLPEDAVVVRVLIDAPIFATWERVTADVHRGASRQREFHESAHARYRSLKDQIPADLVFDSGDLAAADIAAKIITAAGLD